MAKKEKTEAQKLGFYKRALREAWNKSPMKWKAYRRALLRPAWVKCEKCAKETYYKMAEIDHIIPVGSITCEADVPALAARMNCTAEGLQVLCEECHKAKSKVDNKNTREGK
jgi:5-methylcytosine-specific restriction endonuclease McrA